MTEIIYTLIVTHITILCVTIFLHRCQAHRSVLIHSSVAHAMRFWLWLTTGMITKEWVAVHRLHHQKTDEPGDPHSPRQFGIWHVVFGGAWLYRNACQDRRTIQKLGAGTPNDWIERHVYSRYPYFGILIMLAINVTLFGYWGLAVWAVQMLWIPFWAAGVVNGLGHWWGYRNGDYGDTSTNISPWGILIGGEELHNNHHLDPTSAKLSRKWWEFDIGWMWISILEMCGLAIVRNKN